MSDITRIKAGSFKMGQPIINFLSGRAPEAFLLQVYLRKPYGPQHMFLNDVLENPQEEMVCVLCRNASWEELNDLGSNYSVPQIVEQSSTKAGYLQFHC